MKRQRTRASVAVFLLLLLSCGESVAGSVDDTESPTVEISSPPGGAIGGAITIVVTVMDNFGVTRVTLDINGAAWASDDTAPSSFRSTRPCMAPGRTHSAPTRRTPPTTPRHRPM